MGVDAESARRDAWIGTVLGDRYRLLECIGAGGMGLVFSAQHVELGRRFAVKILQQQYSRDGVWVERFRREARAATEIGHENIIDITDIGFAPDGSIYYVMEHLGGETLAATLKREGRLPWARVRGIAEQLCDALAAAHRVGIVHRDLKLSNIFRLSRQRNRDFIKILDFGIAKTLAWESAGKLTATGEVFGTPGYMAPEQICGGKVDARSDIYALGVMLYQLLSGERPFDGATPELVVQQQFTREPKPLAEFAVPPPVEAAIRAALVADPGGRPDSMESFAALMSATTVEPPPPQRSVTPPADHEPTATTRVRVVPQEPATVRSGHGDRRPPRWLLVVPTLALFGFSIKLIANLVAADESAPPGASSEAQPTPDSAPAPETVVPVQPPDPPPVDREPVVRPPAEAPSPAPATQPPAHTEGNPPNVVAPRKPPAQPASETLSSRFERLWPAVQTCLCDYYGGFPPQSATVQLRVDAGTSKLVAEVSGASTKAQTCVKTALAKSRPLKLAPGAKTSESVTKRPKC